jgi:hypothetical protein
MLQPGLPNPDRFPFSGRRSFSEARPTVFARAEGVLLGLFAARPFRALDCGAGIGRVTSTVLLPLFDLVDLVEPGGGMVES